MPASSAPTQLQETGDDGNNPVIAYPDADIVFVSSDQKRFDLHKNILSLSSPVFNGMFSTPQPEHDSRRQRHIPDPIMLSEDGETVQTLVSIIYPDRSGPTDPDFPLLRKTAAAAHKYKMDGVLQYLVQALQVALHQDKDPLRVFAIAFSHNMKEPAVAAANKCLENPWSDVIHPELDDISGSVMLRLQACRRRREQLIDTIIPSSVEDCELAESGKYAPWGVYGCSQCPRAEFRSKSLPMWFIMFLMDVREEFLLQPKGSSVRSVAIFRKALERIQPVCWMFTSTEFREKQCQCSIKAPVPLAGFIERLASRLDKRLQEIKFEMP